MLLCVCTQHCLAGRAAKQEPECCALSLLTAYDLFPFFFPFHLTERAPFFFLCGEDNEMRWIGCGRNSDQFTAVHSYSGHELDIDTTYEYDVTRGAAAVDCCLLSSNGRAGMFYVSPPKRVGRLRCCCVGEPPCLTRDVDVGQPSAKRHCAAARSSRSRRCASSLHHAHLRPRSLAHFPGRRRPCAARTTAQLDFRLLSRSPLFYFSAVLCSRAIIELLLLSSTGTRIIWYRAQHRSETFPPRTYAAVRP